MSDRQTLAVTAFGRFSVVVLDSQTGAVYAELTNSRRTSQKLQLLVAYLLYSGKDAVSFDELIELLWPDEGPDDPLAALRLLVHRARMELDKLAGYKGTELILLKNKAYCWNHEIPVKKDAEEFDGLYAKSRMESVGERLIKLTKAANIYKGHFMPQSSSNQWVMVQDTYYHSKWLAVCEEAVRIMEEFKNNRGIIDLCKTAVSIDPYAESLHIAFLKALAEVGSFATAMEHYKYITNMFMDTFGISPSEELKAVYGKLLKSTDSLGTDIGTIRDSLTNYNDNGAFFLEYEIFKHIYWLKSRECMRSGQVVQLVLITVSPAGGKNPGPRSRQTCMERLGEVISGSLRQGDLCTRYGVMQYLVMLQSANNENGRMILDRISSAFKSKYPKSGFVTQASMLPLMPKSSQRDSELTFG